MNGKPEALTKDPIVAELLEAPDSQLSDGAKEQIRQWSVPPTRAQVQATLNFCVYGAEASSFAMRVLYLLRDSAHG